jgi:signal transduction histidine kinase/CheY-like chemotaxis protein
VVEYDILWCCLLGSLVQWLVWACGRYVAAGGAGGYWEERQSSTMTPLQYLTHAMVLVSVVSTDLGLVLNSLFFYENGFFSTWHRGGGGLAVTLTVGFLTVVAYWMMYTDQDVTFINFWGRSVSLLRWSYYVSTGSLLSISMALLSKTAGLKCARTLAVTQPLCMLAGSVAVSTRSGVIAVPFLISAVTMYCGIFVAAMESWSVYYRTTHDTSSGGGGDGRSIRRSSLLVSASSGRRGSYGTTSRSLGPRGFSAADAAVETEQESRIVMLYRHAMLVGMMAFVWTGLVSIFFCGILGLISEETEDVLNCLVDVLSKAIQASLLCSVHVGMHERLQVVKGYWDMALAANENNKAVMRYVFHEVRVPLNNIYLGLQAIDSDWDKSGPAHAEAMSAALNGVQSMSHVLDEVLSWQRLGDGRILLEKRTVAVKDLLTVVVSEFRHSFEISGVELRLKDCAPSHVLCDPFKIRQVLANCLSNALKFSPKGGAVIVGSDSRWRRASVLSGSLPSPLVRIYVEDQGHGMTEEEVSHLFRPFSQIRPGDLQDGRGSGLGLCISKSIVEQHGGSIWCTTAVGAGTTFHFSLPTVVPVPEGQGAMERLGAKSASPASSSSSSSIANRIAPVIAKRALVVDDVKSTRSLMSRALSKMGLQVDQAENGQVALDLYEARNGDYQLILMDSVMPVMDGVSSVRGLRVMGCTCVILGCTGNAIEEDLQIFLEAGADQVLTKPMKIDFLKRAIESHNLIMEGAVESRDDGWTKKDR